MRTTILILLSLVFVAKANCPSNPQLQVIKAIEQTLKRNSDKKAVPAHLLAPEIKRLSDEYGVSPYTIMRIVLVESRGIPSAYNARTNDYGIMQINGRTMKAYGISKRCALAWKCNLEAGIMILSEMQSITGYRVCMYNLGPKGRFKVNHLPCKRYETKIASIN